MRIERSITTVSWIPSDLLEGMGKIATRMKMAHHDPPPPDSLGVERAGRDRGPAVGRPLPFRQRTARIHRGRRGRHDHRLRVLRRRRDRRHHRRPRCRVDHHPGRQAARPVQRAGSHRDVGSIHPDRRRAHRCADAACRQARSVHPVPRADRVDHARADDPRRRHAPRGDDRCVRVPAALAVRRRRAASSAKSSVAEYKQWMAESFGRRTPWGDEDSPALVSEVETLARARVAGCHHAWWQEARHPPREGGQDARRAGFGRATRCTCC